MKQLLISILCCSLTLFVFGQQNPLLPKYGFNSLLYNPAYAGARHHPFLSVSGLQSLHTGSFNFYNASFNKPLNNPRHAIGVSVIRDRTGVFRQQSFNAVYAYRFIFNKGKTKESTLSIGFTGSVTNWKFDEEILSSKYPYLFIESPSLNRIDLNFGIGLMYYNRFGYVGTSVPYVTNHSIPGVNTNTGIDYIPKQSRNIMVMAGRIIPMSIAQDHVLKPSFVYRYSDVSKRLIGNSLDDFFLPEMELETEIAFTLNKKWEFGTALKMFFRYDYVIEGCDVWMGTQFRNGLKVRAIYNHSIRQEENRSIEIALSYDWYKNTTVITPRFY